MALPAHLNQKYTVYKCQMSVQPGQCQVPDALDVGKKKQGKCYRVAANRNALYTKPTWTKLLLDIDFLYITNNKFPTFYFAYHRFFHKSFNVSLYNFITKIQKFFNANENFLPVQGTCIFQVHYVFNFQFCIRLQMVASPTSYFEVLETQSISGQPFQSISKLHIIPFITGQSPFHQHSCYHVATTIRKVNFVSIFEQKGHWKSQISNLSHQKISLKHSLQFPSSLRSAHCGVRSQTSILGIHVGVFSGQVSHLV